MNDSNGGASGRNKMISSRRSTRSLSRLTLRNNPDEREFRALTNPSVRNIRGQSLSALHSRTVSSAVDSHGHLSSIRMSGCNRQNGRNSDSQPKASLRQEQSSDERFVQTLLYPEASSLIEQIRDIKRRLSEATAELSPTVYPLATRDILTAVSLGRYEAAQHFVSSTQPVSNNGNECTHGRCHCCAGVLSFLAYLISTNSSFEQPRWSELRNILRDQRPIKHTFCCPDIENALKELVSISCELTVSTVPLHEMQEMERRLQAVDAEVVHLQSQMQSLQKLLDDVHSESNWRQSAISEELNVNSMKTSSIVAWLDLATSSPTSDTESELRRQTNNSSRQANEQELDLRAKISALIADKKAELAELRRGAVKWASKHTLIRNKQAEIEELNGVLSNGLALVPDVSESDTIIGSPKLQIPSSEDLIGHIRSLCHDLGVFFQSFKPFNAQKLLPSLKSLSDTLTEALARIQPFTGIAEISGNPTNLDHVSEKTTAHMGYISCQQLEVDRADYGLDSPLTVRIRQPMKLTRSSDTEVQGDGDLQVIDEFLSPSLPASTPRHPLPKQALSSQIQKISQLSDECRNTNAEIEYLKLAVASLKQEVKNNQEALQLLCESRLTLLERVGALTGGDECEDCFADFVSELRQIDSLDEHLKTLDKCHDLLTQRLMNWSRKCQEDSEVALKQKEVEMTHLLARFEEEEALLKSHSDETKELHAQINLLQQPFSSKPYHIQEEVTESVPLLQAFEEPMQPTQAVLLKRTPSADSDQFEPFKRGVGEAIQTSHEASLQSKINDQVATISQLEARLCAQNEEFKAKLAEVDEKVSQFNAIQCAYESDVQQLKTVLRQKTSEVSQLQQMVSSSNQEISDLTEQIKRLKSDSKVLQAELKLAQEEAVMRSLEMENLQGLLNEKTEELSDIREVVMDHEAQMRNLRFVLNNKDVDLMERDRQIEALLNKLAISEADFEAVRKDFAQLNTIFECLWKSTLLIDDSAERSGTLPVVGHEPMLALKSSSAVDQFLSLLSSKESETVVCDVQACIRAYKSLQEKAKEQKCEVDASPTIVRDGLDLPWNPCCVTAVSAISAIMGDAKVFNLLRDLAYSESCRVRLANLLSNVESQKDQLKGMLSALQAEVENNHVQLAERNRQLILLGIDPNDTTVPISVSRTSTSNGSTTVCYVDTGDNVGTEAGLPMVQVVPQASNESDSLKKRVKALEAENTEKAKIIEQMKKLHKDSKESVFSMEQCCQEMELSKIETNRQYRQIENQFLDLKIKKRSVNEKQYAKDKIEKTEKKIQPSGETQDMEAKDKELHKKLEEMEEEIIENRAEKSRLQQQLHKVREKLENLEANIGKGKLKKIPYVKEENTINRLEKLKEIPERKSKEEKVAKDMKHDVKEVRAKGKQHKKHEQVTAEEAKTGRENEIRHKIAKEEIEQKEFHERIEQVVATTLHDAEVVATEMEELRQRLHEVEREKLGKTEECDRLSNEVAVLMRELNEAKARESALMSVSESPVVEPSVVEAVRADPLLSSTPPGLVQKTPVIVDVCHGHEEESSIRRVDEGLLMARLSALAETVSTASSLQAEVRNSWLVVMEHAESGVASLLRDQVDLKVRLGELEANVKSLNAELEEKDARVQMLTRDVAEQGEELQRRDRSLHELEARMTAVSTRLLSQLGDLMSAVNCGEGRVAELMSMVEEAGAREGELKEQLMENVVQSRQLESELAGERAKVSKLGGEVAEKELEKEALLRSCEQMTEELKVKASEQRALEERIEQVVATTLHDAEVVATEMEELRQRLHEVEREKLGKTEECDRLSNEVAVLMRELNEAKARESALMSVSASPIVGPREFTTSSSFVLDSQSLATSVGLPGDVYSTANDVFPSAHFNNAISSSSFIPGCHDDGSYSRHHHKDYCPMTLSSFYASLLFKVFLLQHFVSDAMNIAFIPSSFLEFPILSSSVSSLTAQLSSLLFDLKFAFHSLALASSAMDVGSNPTNDRFSPFTFQPFDSSFLSSAADFLTTNCDRNHDQECDSSSIAKSLLCVAACLHAQLRRSIYRAFGCAQEKSTLDDEVEFLLSSWFDFFSRLQNLCQRTSSKLWPTPNVPIAGLTCICHLAPAEVDQQLNAKSSLKSEPLFRTSPLAPTFSAEFLSLHATKPKLLTKYYSQSEPNLDLSTEQDLQKRRVIQSLDAFLQSLSTYTGHYKKLSPFPLATLANQLSKLRLWLVDDTRQPFNAPTVRKASYPSVPLEIPSTELYLRRLLNIRDTEVLYLLNNLPGGENLINRSSTSNFFPSRDCTEAQLELMSNWDMVQPIDPSCLPVYRVKLPEVRELPVVTNGHQYVPPTAEALLSSQNDLPPPPSTPASEISHNSLNLESRSEIKSLLRRCWNLLKEMVSILKRSPRSKLLRTRADELLDTSLRLSRLLNGDASASLVYEAVADTAAHVYFKRIPDSPSPPRSWSKAPIQELIWAIETLDDIEELRSLAHLLTQQYNAIGTTLEQQLNVNRNLRDRLREANNHLAHIYLGISQGSQRLAVMTERLLVEAHKQDGINSTCDDFVSLKPYSQSLISEDDVEACAQSGASDPPALANLPSSSQKTEQHRTATLLRNLQHAMRSKSKK